MCTFYNQLAFPFMYLCSPKISDNILSLMLIIQTPIMKLLFSLLLTFISLSFYAQEISDEYVPMRVLKCSAVENNDAITNIFVDDSNVKWVATATKLYQVHSADNSSAIDIENDEWNLLMQKEGNHSLSLNYFELEKFPNTRASKMEPAEDVITTTFYDKKKKNLWIGTAKNGLYKYKVNPEVKLIKQYNSSNSKLIDDHITSVLVDKYSRVWIGTKKGVLLEGEKSKLFEDKKEIKEITALGPDVWIMGDDILYRVTKDNRWYPGDVDQRLASGVIKDMIYDSDGKLWVASDIITRYDIEKDLVEVFDASNGFTGKNISRILTDQDNALWVGTQEDGLFLIDKEANLTVTCLIDTKLSCVGQENDASLLVKAFGGEEPYLYSWSKDIKGPNPQNLGPGLYTVTVSDQSGLSKIVSANIEDKRMQVQFEIIKHPSHAQSNDGRAVVNVSGGVPPYKYLWSSKEKGTTANNLGSGPQEVEISDNNGCVHNVLFKMKGKEVSVTPDALLVNIKQEGEAMCHDSKSLNLLAEVTGGQAPYTYQWENLSETSATLKDVKAGNYSLRVIDVSGKSISSQYKVVTPSPIILNLSQTQAVSGSRKRDGMAQVAAKGGSGRYTYEWSNGATSKSIKKLIIGKYSVTVTDDNSCTATGAVEVNERINKVLASGKLKKGQTIPIKKLYFEADSTNLTSISEPTLNELYEFLIKNDNIDIEVGGHTNNVPEEEFCDRLSTARAKSVADYLWNKGIKKERIQFVGYGKRKPIASNKTPDGRRRNQRVELKILNVR